MEEPLHQSVDEIKRLRRCISDLISVLALPALWVSGGPKQIGSTLLVALLEILAVDVACVRLKEPGVAGSLEMIRCADSQPPGSEEIRKELSEALDNAPGGWANGSRLRLGREEFSMASAPLGLQGDLGIVVVGASRDFPLQTDVLLLNVAANEAAIGLQQALLLNEQCRVANELDDRVAQRTAELAAANDTLQAEFAERRRAEEALRASERDALLIVESVPGLVALLAATGEVELVNGPMLEFFGQTLEELKQWGTNDTVHPEDLPQVLDVFGQSIASGAPYQITQRFKRRDGAYRWFVNSGYPVRDFAGRIVRWCVLLTEIDDLKRAEDAIRRNERNLQLTIDTIPALVWTAQTDGSAIFFNRHYLDYIGFTPDQAMGWGWTAAVHEDDLSGLQKAWASIQASDQPGEAEARLRRFDGEYRWFLLRTNPLRDESGRTVAWYGINTDIDDRKRAESELRRSEAFLEAGQRSARVGTFSWSVESDEITCSDQFYRIFEFDRGLLVTLQRIESRVHPEDRPQIADLIVKMRGNAIDIEFAQRLLMPGGAVKHVRVVAHGAQEEDGRLEYIGAVQDVTVQHLSEEALSQARSDLAHVARVTSLSAFTASIAHEVNQPLSGIITNAGTCLRMLNSVPPNVEGARETARRTIRDGNRASDVIARLRALFSKKELTLESMNLNEAAQDVVALSLKDLQRNGVLLQSELADDLPVVMGDRVQLQQVILNLIRNASEAMTDVHDRPRLLLIRTGLEADEQVRLTVRDTGVGFESGDTGKLFEAFHTTKNGGMGIGLSVSRSIIERHRGRIWAETNNGPGAAFSFCIPRDPQAAPAAPFAARKA